MVKEEEKEGVELGPSTSTTTATMPAYLPPAITCLTFIIINIILLV